MATTINEELIEKQVSVKDSVGDDDAAAAAEEDTSILQIMIEKEDEIRVSGIRNRLVDCQLDSDNSECIEICFLDQKRYGWTNTSRRTTRF